MPVAHACAWVDRAHRSPSSSKLVLPAWRVVDRDVAPMQPGLFEFFESSVAAQLEDVVDDVQVDHGGRVVLDRQQGEVVHLPEVKRDAFQGHELCDRALAWLRGGGGGTGHYGNEQGQNQEQAFCRRHGEPQFAGHREGSISHFCIVPYGKRSKYSVFSPFPINDVTMLNIAYFW